MISERLLEMVHIAVPTSSFCFPAFRPLKNDKVDSFELKLGKMEGGKEGRREGRREGGKEEGKEGGREERGK